MLKNIFGESTFYEKKEKVETKKAKNWLKTISAFANGKGGILIFGINDNDEVVGLSDYKKDSEFISEKIKSQIEPIPNIKIENKLEKGKILIFVTVEEGNQTPYYYIGNNTRTAFIRNGNQTIEAQNYKLNDLILKGSNQTFDSLETSIKFEQASFSKLKASYFFNSKKEFFISNFESFGLVKGKNLTNAGALLADEKWIYQSRIFMTRWNGLTKASGKIEAFDDLEIEGSIIFQLEETIRFIKRNSKKMWKKISDKRIELFDYPERAVQEVVVNAIIHRDYNILGSEIHIDIFDDRMEIFSPGGMYDGTKIQDINTERVASKRRNPIIADLFSRMNLMERRGSGLKKIEQDYIESYNYTIEKKVEFYSENDEFRVILKNLNYRGKIKREKNNFNENNQIEIIMNFFEENDEISRKDVEKLLNLKERRARAILNNLIQKNLIKKIGNSKNIRYIKYK